MSLQVWLPLNGDLHNQGLSNVTVTNNGSTVDNNGKIGKCYSFDGTNDYIVLNNITCSKWAAFSLTCWCYPITDFNYLFLIRSSGAHRVRVSGDGFMFRDSNNSAQRIIGFGETIPQNQWSHIACVYNRGEVLMYINGVLTNHNTNYYHDSSTLLSDHNEIRIARSQSSSGNSYYSGKINDFRIYDHALSVKEVEEIAKGLVLHYKLDQPNNNILTQEILHTAPFASATTFVGDYEGYNDVLSVRNNTLYSATSKGQNDIFTGITWDGDIQYTLSGLWRDDRTDGKNSSMQFRFHYTDNTTTTIKSPQSKWGQWIPFKLTSTTGKSVDKITTTYGNAGNIYIANFKLEVGSNQTSFLGFIPDNVIYDSSGYNNNGEQSNITIITPSPRYSVATNFSNSAYIKVIDNKWMAQGIKEMTINLWAKTNSWPTTGRLFSCTESGGFNLEAGSSGYWRFPVNVYTNSAQSSTAYKYDSQEIKISDLPINEWVMFTLIYDSTGTKTYINGELHHTYANVSYGIHFNTNARLFLGCEANTANPSSPYFTGQMSDFRIYNTVLTEEQIKELYNTSMTIDNQGNIHVRELVEI